MPSDQREPPKNGSELTNLLEQLCKTGADFILVGGLAAVSQGAPIATFDIDIVPSSEKSNLRKLLDFLLGVNARHRGRSGGQVIRPTLKDLTAGGHCLLMTDLGPLDLLGTIEQELGYDDLLDDSSEIQFRGHSIKVLNLEAMIRMKRSSVRDKDQRYLPLLEETLRRSREK
jgi:predicted nucleotidyltransferase